MQKFKLTPKIKLVLSSPPTLTSVRIFSLNFVGRNNNFEILTEEINRISSTSANYEIGTEFLKFIVLFFYFLIF